MIKITAVIFFVLCLFLMFSDYLKPSVTIYNNSGDIVFYTKAPVRKMLNLILSRLRVR